MSDGPDERAGWAPLDAEPDAPAAPTGLPAPPAATPPPPPPGAWGRDQPPPTPPPPPPGWGQPPPPPPGWGQPAAPTGWGPAAFDPARMVKAGNERTGPLPLHPMTVSDILDGAFKLIKANAATVFGIAAAITLPLQLVSSFFLKNSFLGLNDLRALSDPSVSTANAQAQTAGTGGQLAGAGIAVVLALIVTPFVAGAISRVVAASYLGDQLPAGPALRTTLRRGVALLVAFLLVHLLELVSLAACILPILAVMTLCQAVSPAIMVEELGPLAGIKRSWQLMRTRFWGHLLVAVLAGVISYFLRTVLSVLPTLLAFVVPRSFRWVVVGMGGGVATLLTVPIVAVVATLVYFDARIRTEGFDLQMIASDLARGSG